MEDDMITFLAIVGAAVIVIGLVSLALFALVSGMKPGDVP